VGVQWGVVAGKEDTTPLASSEGTGDEWLAPGLHTSKARLVLLEPHRVLEAWIIWEGEPSWSQSRRK